MTGLGRSRREPSLPRTCITVGTTAEQHSYYAELLSPMDWTVIWIQSADEVLAVLRDREVSVLIANDQPPPELRRILDDIKKLSCPPKVIVALLDADDVRWSEIIAAGAFDLLLNRYDRQDVRCVVRSAWLAWINDGGRAPATSSHSRTENRAEEPVSVKRLVAKGTFRWRTCLRWLRRAARILVSRGGEQPEGVQTEKYNVY